MSLVLEIEQAVIKGCCCESRGQNVGLEVEQIESPSAFEPAAAGEPSSIPETETEKPGWGSPSDDEVQGLEAVDLRRTSTSRAFLRGISLRKSLRRGGALWRHKPAELDVHDRSKLYRSSEPVEKLDLFLSHTWLTPGRWKFVSMLVFSGWRYMLGGWAIGAGLAVSLVMLEVLPLSQPLEFRVVGFPGTHNTGFWVTIGGFFSAACGLMAFPYLPSFHSDVSFIDSACIHQTDPVLMRQGIQNIGGFLEAAAELRVLWSEPLLTRLWCCFELAAYRKVNPTGRISIVPIFREIVVCQLFVLLHCISLFNTLGMNIVLVTAGVFLLPMVHSLRGICMYKKQLFSGLGTFDVKSLTCENEDDQAHIHAAIEHWYGSLDSFSEHVRGPFRQYIEEQVCIPGSMPMGYVCLCVTPSLASGIDILLSLWKAGAPNELILAYSLSAIVSTCLFWFPTINAILLFACERWPLKADTHSRAKNILLTIAICAVVWVLVATGLAVATTACRTGLWMVILWMGITLLCAALSCGFFLREQKSAKLSSATRSLSFNVFGRRNPA